MSYIYASKLAEFLDDHKNEKLNRESLRTNPDLLEKAGVSVSENGRKFGRKIRTLEYFLLRSQLYRAEGNSILPDLISTNWTDYTRAWRTTLNGEEIHVPFLGKIAFLCEENGIKKVVCHPDSVASIDKILIDMGMLTFQKDPDKTNLMYKAKTCEEILEADRQRKLTPEFLEEKGNTPFGRALLSLGLARKMGKSFRLIGDGLLLTEMKKMREDNDFEKVARLILREEQLKQAQISSIIVCLEYLERRNSPSENPVGFAPRYWESIRTGKRYERLGHYEIVEGVCSLDSRVTTNILSRTGGPGFVAFGAFFDTYDRIGLKAGQDWVESFAFLSWNTDSLAYLNQDAEKLGTQLKWPRSKISKTQRHKAFLLRFARDTTFHVADQKGLMTLKSRIKGSEAIDMNIDLKKFSQLSYSGIEYCNSNTFLTTRVAVSRDLFEATVLEILQSPSRFKDSQGAFYYPDFRFLVASTLGLAQRTVDQILAYVISTGSDLGRRLWFFPAFGRVPIRERPDQQLREVVLKPFDSITLNY